MDFLSIEVKFAEIAKDETERSIEIILSFVSSSSRRPKGRARYCPYTKKRNFGEFNHFIFKLYIKNRFLINFIILCKKVQVSQRSIILQTMYLTM